MYLLKGIINRYSCLSILIRLVGLICIFNITACNCNKDKPKQEESREEDSREEKQPGSLLMMLTKTNLVGSNKTAEVILKLSDNTKTTPLKDFTLRISLPKEENSTGNRVEYEVYKDKDSEPMLKEVSPVEPIEEKLTSLTTLKKLSPNDEPIKLNFTFTTEPTVTKLVATLELLDAQGHPLQNGTGTVTWEADGILALDQIKYDIVNQEITYRITNLGTTVPKDLKLEYSTTTPGIKLNGKELVPGEKKINDLASLNILPRSSIETHVLGKLDFNKNKNANFEFKLVYEGRYITTKPHTFNIEGVDLYIDKLSYDPSTGMITYNIKNRGTAKASDVQLQYSNISNEKENPDGRTVLLEGVSTGIINPRDIAGNNGETGDGQLAIDFKYANKATFQFNLLYNETPITQETKIETFEARPVSLKLVPLTPLNLIGAQQEVKFRIEQDPQSRLLTNIDISKLKLAVINELGNEAYFWNTADKEENPGELAVNKLIGDISNELILYVEAGSAKDAQFSLQLTYKGLPIPNASPIQITWKEATLAIQESSDFVNDNIATFKLKNLSTAELIDPKSITIQLVSNNTIEFALLKSDNSEVGNSVDLNQLIGDNLLRPNTPTNPIQFRLANAKGEGNATVTIIAKRGNAELAKQTVRWENQPISMQIITEKKSFKDQEILHFSIKNNGPLTNLDKIKVHLTNNQGAEFKLTGTRDIIKDNIEISLKDILDLDKLEKGQIVDFDLELAEHLNINTTIYCIEVILEIQNNNQPLDKVTLVWVNDKELQFVRDIAAIIIPEHLEEVFVLQENINAQINEQIDDPYIFYQNISQLITSQNSLKALQESIEPIIQDIEDQYNDMNQEVYLMVNLINDFRNQVLVNLNKLVIRIDDLITISLNYAKKQIEKFAEEAETTPNQDNDSGPTKKMESWLSILTTLADGQLVLETKEIATRIIKELEENKNNQTATKVSKITKTPDRLKTQKKLKRETRKKQPRSLSFSDKEIDNDTAPNANISTQNNNLPSTTLTQTLLRKFQSKSTRSMTPGTYSNLFRPKSTS